MSLPPLVRQHASFVRRQLIAVTLTFVLALIVPCSNFLNYQLLTIVRADSSAQTLPFTQNWTDTSLITTDDDWSGVPGIIGYRGDDLTTATGTNPQTILADGSSTPVDVNANQTNPSTFTAGGVAEFHIADATIALQGSGTADAPHIVVNLNTTGQLNVNVAYNLRDIDGSSDNAVQAVALQYRVGSSGNYTNIAAGFVADATTGPGLATLVTPVSVTLPAAANDQPLVQVRVITTNAAGNDEWVGIDDLNVTGTPTGGMPLLSINDVAIAEGGSGATTTARFTVTLSVPAGKGGVTFDIATQDGTATTSDNDYVARSLAEQIIAQGSQTYDFDVTVNGDSTTEPDEDFFVNVTNVSGAIVVDGQGRGIITNDDIQAIPIHAIQGRKTISPFTDSIVTTAGIVTGRRTNGFFIQTPDADVDTDPNTSEGIFVFTSSAPPSVAAYGNAVFVTGRVVEFRPTADPHSPPLTEISGMPTVSLISMGQDLPTPITLMIDDTSPSGSIEQLEKYEGMRVRAKSLTVIAPTDGFLNEPSATATSDGTFYGVLTGIARPLREPGVEVPDPLPLGAPCCVPRFDANPERLRVDSDAQPGAIALNVTTGATLTNVTGPLDYGFRAYTILPDPPTITPTPSVSGIINAIPVPAPMENELTVSSFNLQRFYDTINDPATSDVVLTPAAFNNRLNKASLAIRNVLRAPDVLGVIEMENLSTLQTLAAKINADAVTAGQPNPNYQPYLEEGRDPGGIDVGFLVKTTGVEGGPRVTAISVVQEGRDAIYINPVTGLPEILNDRPPLILRATVQRPAGGVLPFTVIVNHLRSLVGAEADTDAGRRIRAKRRAQSEFLAALIQARQTIDPTENIVAVGDFNAFQFNDGFVDVMGTISGQPAPPDQVVLASSDLVNPDLHNLIESLPVSERYSYVFDGNAQALDHALVTNNFRKLLTRFAYARLDADYPETFRNDANRPERISDHDAPVAYFNLASAVTIAEVMSQVGITFEGLRYSH